MRLQPQGCRRSVDRGTCRLGIELRNNRDWSADVVPHGGRQHRRMRYREHRSGSAQSKTPSMHGNSTRENREAPSTPVAEGAAGRLEKALSPKSSMHVDGESDGRVVPAKCPNKGEQAPTEGMEGRRPTKENIGQATPPRTQSRTSELSDLHGVREVARRVNLIPTCASTPGIRGRSRMQQFCTYGSVRGAPGNRRPYRDKTAPETGVHGRWDTHPA